MNDIFESEVTGSHGRIAYIKPTGSEEAHRLGLIPANVELPQGVKLYVLHAEDGSVLGYTDAYASAFFVWRAIASVSSMEGHSCVRSLSPPPCCFSFPARLSRRTYRQRRLRP